MTTALDILEDIELCGNGRNDKIALLKKHQELQELKWICGITYDYRITFGITTRPYKVANPQDTSMQNWKNFLRLLHLYRNRDLTGNAARDAWKELFEQLEDGERKWYTRILNRDLKCGVSIKTINAAWPDYLKTFGVMLAQTYKPSKMTLKFPVFVEPKFDGMRVLVVIRDNVGKAYSRNGLELDKLEFIVDECVELVEPDYDCVFDGEIYSDHWNDTMSLVKSGKISDKLRKRLCYNVFDFVSLECFENGLDKTPYKDRKKALGAFEDGIRILQQEDDGCHIVLVKATEAMDEDHVMRLYEEALTDEYEGIMIKDPNAPYSEGRGKSWLKVKPEDTKDAKIIGTYEGREGTKLEGSFGGFIVALENGEEMRVGGSFKGSLSDERRNHFWSIRKTLPGQWLEYIEQKETNKKAVTKKARFGRFVRLRPDKN